MNIRKFNLTGNVKTLVALFLILFLSLTLLTACGSAESSSKKDKSKKAKKVEDDEEDTAPATKKEAENTNTGNKTADEKKEKTEKVSADALWAELMAGNKRFMAGKHTAANYSASRVALSKGQKPQFIILGCADSRVPPEFIFDRNLGELFVVRDAGNIADEVSLGSIEYAVEHLHAKMIVVLGHESCGAVAAAVSGEKMPTRNLSAIVDSITPAFEGSKDCVLGDKPNMACVELNANHSAKDLLEKSPIIKKAVEEGEVAIVAAVYHFDTGEVVRLKE
ncbi:MAG: carbonic anhydrase [Acidobacteria bacterium]|nr:carbonic anhydrase [Acidobacteriota bacterium]